MPTSDAGPMPGRDASLVADAGGLHDAAAPLDAGRGHDDAQVSLDAAGQDASPPRDASATDGSTLADATAAGDAGGGAPDAAAGASFAEVQAIFDARCVGCHDASARGLPTYAALPLTSDASYAALVDQPAHESCGGVLVKPGKPDESYLVHKTTDSPPCEGQRMPRPFEVGMVPPLTDAQHATIRAWIAAGAPH